MTEPLTTITYTYGNEAWGDLLTAYNGTDIFYDGAGNPTSYLNGLKFNWTQGRQLSRVYTIRGTVATYQYDTEGIRIGKNVGGVTTKYFLDATGTMQALERGIEKLVFFYDVTGRREGFSYYINDELVGNYYYVYNAQGDVRAILDSNFEVVELYDYDSWGKPLSTTGELAQSIGTLNPFRYRGYIYDEETGFYYLNSRYYDPVVGRFLNADSVISNVGGDVRGYNLFAYCFNNPVNMKDSSGYWGQWIKDGFNWFKDNVVQPLIEDYKNFNMNNEDENAVLEANYFSAYKDTLAIKLPIGENAFSFGILFIGNQETSRDTVRHEYGHKKQLENMGCFKYAIKVVVPSLTLNLIDIMGELPYDYYSYPWEAEADSLGGVIYRDFEISRLPSGSDVSYWDLIQLLFE